MKGKEDLYVKKEDLKKALLNTIMFTPLILFLSWGIIEIINFDAKYGVTFRAQGIYDNSLGSFMTLYLVFSFIGIIASMCRLMIVWLEIGE